MMDLLLATSGGESQSASGGYVDDVFSTYLYTGNGSTQTINNGIDLVGRGGMVWAKNRNAQSHNLQDTSQGIQNRLVSNSTIAASGTGDVSSVTASGFVLTSVGGQSNTSGESYVSWTFRRAKKFFDVVTYTGDGTSNRQIAHSLGVAPGMVIVKRTDSTSAWYVQHRSIPATSVLQLNTPDIINLGTAFGNTYGGVSNITVGGNINANGASYVAYLFAHDPSAEGIIQCGSFTSNGSYLDIALGWEIQYLLVKRIDSAGDWQILDTTRGLTVSPNGDVRLSANTAEAEVTGVDRYNPTSMGFASDGGGPGTFIYLAIRRPNKPPTTGTQVYNAIVRTGTGAAATVTGVGFAPDLVHSQDRVQQLAGSAFYDRLRGGAARLLTTRTDAEFIDGTQIRSFNMDGYTAGVDTVPYPAINSPSVTYINHFFRRAAGFMDMVCYTGTGVARTVPHNLGVAPELMIVKMRTGASAWAWYVYSAPTGAGNVMYLNEVYAASSSSTWDNAAPSASAITLSTANGVNQSGTTYVAYLFASLPGISKVGSYTGNGSSQTINCGFSTGSRFILVKRTDATGDWYVWDSVRGIIAANDPHLSLNTAAAEVTTDDSVDPDASGFIVNQNTATNINVSGGQYIFLAIA